MFGNGKLTPEQRLQKAVIAIMHHERYRALAGVLMIGSRTVDTHIRRSPVDTAATDGMNEVYNPDFIASLKDSELRFLVLHENYHKLYKHLTTWRWMYLRHAQMANASCDFVLNIKLVDDNKADRFATMTGPLLRGCFDEKYRDWDSAAVFHDLLKNAKQGGGGGQGEPGQPGEPGQGEGQGEGQPGQGFDTHDWDGAQDMPDADKQALARDIDEAVRQGALMAGKTGSGGDRSLEDLMQPQVDWRTALRDFITTTCAGSDFSTWKRPNRRFIGGGYYMPSGITERVKDICVAIDASGSIGGPQLASFFSEVRGIADSVRPERVHLLYWDTEVCRHEVYLEQDLPNLVTSTKPEGGGGTMVECVPEFLNKNGIAPQAVIMLTDGYLGGGWGTWTCPVLWTILDNKSARPAHGATIHIKGHEL